MLKQIELNGQRFELHSKDGHTFFSNPHQLLDYPRHQEELRKFHAISERHKSFINSIESVDDADPYHINL